MSSNVRYNPITGDFIPFPPQYQDLINLLSWKTQIETQLTQMTSTLQQLVIQVNQNGTPGLSIEVVQSEIAAAVDIIQSNLDTITNINTTQSTSIDSLTSQLSSIQTQLTTLSNNISTFNSHVSASTGVHGITGSVVGTTDGQVLTNKTIVSPILRDVFKTQSTNVCTIATGPGSGTGANASIVGTQQAGIIELTTGLLGGVGSSSAVIITMPITMTSTNYTISLTPMNTNAAAVTDRLYTEPVSTTQWRIINGKTIINILTPGATYKWNYFVV